jgi:secondary thiamine-phosphate synthase enzyme
MVEELTVETAGQGLIEITGLLTPIISQSNLEQGLCTVFVTHTSASLIIQENADPSARRDLERWLNRLVPENDGLYTHTTEGTDDMPAHIKAMLTSTSLSIPFINGRPGLGTWQGVYLWEHRRRGSRRRLLVHLGN